MRVEIIRFFCVLGTSNSWSTIDEEYDDDDLDNYDDNIENT